MKDMFGRRLFLGDWVIRPPRTYGEVGLCLSYVIEQKGSSITLVSVTRNYLGKIPCFVTKKYKPRNGSKLLKFEPPQEAVELLLGVLEGPLTKANQKKLLAWLEGTPEFEEFK